VGDNKSATAKNAGKLAILIAIRMRQYNAGYITDGAHPGLHSKPLDVAIERVLVPYLPGGRHGQRIC
jgi:hypothetical protein